MPTKRVAVLGVLAFEILRAVLTDDLDPGFCEDSQVGERDVLRPATIVTVSPTSARMRS